MHDKAQNNISTSSKVVITNLMQTDLVQVWLGQVPLVVAVLLVVSGDVLSSGDTTWDIGASETEGFTYQALSVMSCGDTAWEVGESDTEELTYQSLSMLSCVDTASDTEELLYQSLSVLSCWDTVFGGVSSDTYELLAEGIPATIVTSIIDNVSLKPNFCKKWKQILQKL